MNNELKAAAEEWRVSRTYHPFQLDAPIETIKAMRVLADAMLARLAADEAERAEREKAIDEEWFATIQQKKCGFEVLRTNRGLLQLWMFAGDATTWISLPPMTRGQLLDLLRALGIQVKP